MNKIAIKTIYGEARGEGFIGMKAVAHVLLNRARIKNQSLDEVCLKPWQFSCWNKNDPNREKLEKLEIETNQIALQCAAALSEAEQEDDFTKGATHYHTNNIEPKWAKGKTPCFIHKNHRFYNDIAW